MDKKVTHQNIVLTLEHVYQNVTVTHKDDGGTTYIYCDENGEINATVYSLISGVSLIYKNVYRADFVSDCRVAPANALFIEHCQEGNLICQINGEKVCHAAGDIVLLRTDRVTRFLHYPTKYYRALTILIDWEQLTNEYISFFHQAHIDIQELMKQIYYLPKNDARIEKIFHELSNAPKLGREAYCSVKIAELLILLTAIGSKTDEHFEGNISKLQVETAKKAHTYLMEHLCENITINEQAEQLSVSPTYLKMGFHTVYGVSIKRFAREQRMYEAARLLKETNWKISDIAAQLGYSNASKFTATFQNIIGKTPSRYRSDS